MEVLINEVVVMETILIAMNSTSILKFMNILPHTLNNSNNLKLGTYLQQNKTKSYIIVKYLNVLLNKGTITAKGLEARPAMLSCIAALGFVV